MAAGWQLGLPALAGAISAIGAGRIYASPLHRCAEPARALAARLDLPFETDARLLELDFGDWDGRAWDDLPLAALDRWALDPVAFAPPGGESGGALIRRVQDFAAMLRRRSRACLVLSHGGPLRLLPALLRQEPADLLAKPPDPGSLQIVRASSM